MTDKRILELALKRVSKNGYKHKFRIDEAMGLMKLRSQPGSDLAGVSCSTHVNEIIFDHKFAKALWGFDWEVHLQKMVIEKEPLQYIKHFLSRF